MNKLLLSLSVAVLLTGCDRAAENKTVTPQNEMNQSTPVDPAATTAKTSTVNPDTPPVSTTSPATTVDPAVPATRAPVNTEVDTTTEARQNALTDTTTNMPTAAPVNPDQPDTVRNENLTNSSKTEVIDASSEDAMTASLDRMIAHLSESEKEAFAEAFLIYAMSKVDMSLDETTNQKNMLAALNGKSVNDIMTEANKIKANAGKTTPPQTTQP